MNTITFIDTETTGLDRRRHEPWEIAAITYELGNDGTSLGRLIDTTHAFVEPVIFTEADPVALKYNRFWERTGERGFTWHDREKVADKLSRIFESTHIAAMNVTFDRDMIDIFLDYAGRPPGGWHYHLIELETLMIGYIRGNGYTVTIPYKSDDLSKSIGVEPPPKGERHTAMADAKWCRDVFAQIWPVSDSSAVPEPLNLPEWAQVEMP